MNLIKFMVFLLGWCCFSSVTAETYNYRETIAKWVISGEKDSDTHKAQLCIAGTKNKNRSQLGLALADSIDGLMIVITTSNWYKLNGRNVSLTYSSDIGNKGIIYGSVIEKGKIHLNTSRDFITMLRAAHHVTFNQNLFSERFSLKGSNKALKKLIACADENKDLSNLPIIY